MAPGFVARRFGSTRGLQGNLLKGYLRIEGRAPCKNVRVDDR